jgi:hypothetical protein
MLLQRALLSGLFAGLVASLATYAIERLGSRLGGVLATAPSTIVVFCIALTSNDDDDMKRACYAVPFGMFVDVLFLRVWQVAPQLACVRSKERSLCGSLSIVVSLSLLFWLACAGLALAMLAVFELWHVPFRVPGLVVFAGMLTFGIVINRHQPPKPKQVNRIGCLTYAARGLLAGVAIFGAVLFGTASNTVAGMLSTFPAIFLTTMVSLSVSQGEAVQVGCIGPLSIGANSVVMFALVFAELFKPLNDAMSSHEWSVVLCTLIVFVLCVLLVSMPLFFYLQWRRAVTKRSNSNAPLPAAPDLEQPADEAECKHEKAEAEAASSSSSSTDDSKQTTTVDEDTVLFVYALP